jgi:hypothetical protein
MSSDINNDNRDLNFNNFNNIVKEILSFFKIPETIAPRIPPSTVVLSKSRPGLSPSKIAARIIRRQSEAGAPIGDLPDGTESITEKMEVIRVEEIINALTTEARITTAIEPNIQVVSTGANAGGPIVTNGQTVTLGSGYSVIQ